MSVSDDEVRDAAVTARNSRVAANQALLDWMDGRIGRGGYLVSLDTADDDEKTFWALVDLYIDERALYA